MTAARTELLDRVGGDVPVMAVLEAILRLRQSCCDTRLVTNSAPPVASSKIEALMESLDEAIANDHRCLVFSQWTSMLDLVEEELDSAKIRYLRLDGTTRDRGGAVAEFQSAEGPPVFLISLKAGGVGLTLTAADHVFVLDPWWNPAVEEQATDRAHRIGQENPVFVYRIIAADTIEDRILELQARKRELARSLVGGGDGGEADMVAGGCAGALSVSREELLELLG
jgi:SNF2 family DNA or RNA helicase